MDKDWRKDLARDISDSRIKADLGDAEAQFHCFILLSSEAMSNCSQQLFDEAEKYLEQAAAQRYKEAVDRLENQVIFRRAFDSRVRRSKGI